MDTKFSSLRWIVVLTAIMLNICFTLRGQYLDGASGLLQMPSAKMNQSGTFMITNSFMNKHTLPEDAWGYHSFGYGFDLTFLQRLEFYYTCVIFDGKRKPNPSERDNITFNQDRHLGVKAQLLRSGDFGQNWLPDLAVGINDFDNGMISNRGPGNGFFTRVYAVASKDFPTKVGNICAHLGYQFNNWTYYSLSGPMVAVDWMPIWLQKEEVIKTRLIAEYDARTFNIGAIVSLWKGHLDAMVELMAMKWVNFGVRYKLQLKS